MYFFIGQMPTKINFFSVKCRILTNHKKIPLTHRFKDALKGQDRVIWWGLGPTLISRASLDFLLIITIICIYFNRLQLL